MTELENYSEIIEEIAEGSTKKLKQLGLNKKNVDNLLGSGNLIQVKSASGKPFLRAIRDATPLIYAILCEQLDTVLYLILNLHASLGKSVISFYYLIYNIFIYFFYGIYFYF